MLKVDLSKDSLKFLQNIPANHGAKIARRIELLQNEPEPPDSLLMKGLKFSCRRVAVAEYRIIYNVEADVLKIILIGKRNDSEVYKKLKRK